VDKVAGRLTVFFEDPFWVGVFERSDGIKLSAAKVTFGAEPKDYEIYNFILNHYYDLRFSPAVDAIIKTEKKNPKRIQRDIKKKMANVGVGTKSQQALKLQQEQIKMERKGRTREQKKADAQQQFELKQQKKKNKRRGR